MIEYKQVIVCPYITKTMTAQQIKELEKKLVRFEKRKRRLMPIISTKAVNVVITAYASGKVVFQGEGARSYADITSALR